MAQRTKGGVAINTLVRCNPEEEGLPSSSLSEFTDCVNKSGADIHGFMLLRHGRVMAEKWWAPHTAAEMHYIKSITKSITAIAVGFAEQEGILALDEKLVDLFPDRLPDNVSENLKQAAIEHLLTMTLGDESKEYGSDDEIKVFLSRPMETKPGAQFAYNSDCATVLCAVIKQKTGLTMSEFLKPRLFEPLGIDAFSCITSPEGIEYGGSGGYLAAESLAKFMQFILQRGKWNGRQLLNEDWVRRATSSHIKPGYDQFGVDAGYGYGFWILGGSIAALGALGQCGFAVPSLDVATVAYSNDENYTILPLLTDLISKI